jgi:hypothetical protein
VATYPASEESKAKSQISGYFRTRRCPVRYLVFCQEHTGAEHADATQEWGSPMTGFSDLFRAATGKEPYPYQKEFATRPEVPSLVSVPIGCGGRAARPLGDWNRPGEASGGALEAMVNVGNNAPKPTERRGQ